MTFAGVLSPSNRALSLSIARTDGVWEVNLGLWSRAFVFVWCLTPAQYTELRRYFAKASHAPVDRP